MAKNYLIVGLGFIGINLLRELWLRQEKVTVFSQTLDENLVKLFGNEVTFVKGDIRDANLVKKVVQGQDVIYSLAGRSGQVASLKEPFLDLEVNLHGQLLLLEAVKNLNPKARLVFPGSRLEYGRPLYLPVDEKHPLNPVSLYGIHKLTAEKYYLEYHSIFGLKTTVLRITNPYGAHLKRGGSEYNIVNLFIDKALKGENLPVFGDGGQLRDYIYVQDLVEIMIRLAGNEKAVGQAINVGTGKGVGFGQMAETVANAFGVKTEKIAWPKDAEKVETGDFIAEVSLLKSLVDQNFTFTRLEAGVQKTQELMTEKTDTFWSKLY